MISEIRQITGDSYSVEVQLIERDKAGNVVNVRNYDGVMAALILEVAEHCVRVADARFEELKQFVVTR